MKTKWMFPLILAFPIAFAACSKDSPQEENGAVSDEYPLTTCVVSGEPLGSMGDPYVHEHNGTTVKFCCESCLPKFNENPDSYIAKVKGS